MHRTSGKRFVALRDDRTDLERHIVGSDDERNAQHRRDRERVPLQLQRTLYMEKYGLRRRRAVQHRMRRSDSSGECGMEPVQSDQPDLERHRMASDYCRQLQRNARSCLLPLQMQSALQLERLDLLGCNEYRGMRRIARKR